MEVTFGAERGFSGRPGGEALLERLAALGATSVETYVRWSDFEPEPGHFDWSVFDADLEALGRHGLRWVPFFIAGPWYATPAWFRSGERSVFFRCLEHGRETGAQSLWSPHLRAEIARVVGAFADHYRGSDRIESLLLGITGDYGEAIYPVTGNWPGDYHGHGGYWCGDPHARADFQGFIARRHGTPAALAAAWGTAPQRFTDLVPPASPAAAGSRRAWLDFVAWYRGAMTDWAAFWLAEARQAWPEVELYLCTGGDMLPAHGSDFSAQCQVAAAAGAGIRITNEGSDYVANLMLTRLVACGTAAHDSFCGIEPAAAITPAGIAARQFNAITSGARQLHEYHNNVVRERPDGPVERGDAAAAWRRGRERLQRRQPRWDVALVMSLPDLALREAGIGGGLLALARALRPAVDFALLDDALVAAGALGGIRAAFCAPAALWAPETAAALAAFVAAGGICVAAGPRPATWDGPETMGPLFGFGPDADELTGISAVRPASEEAAALLPTYRALPRQTMARSYTALDPAITPLLRLAHMPVDGRAPLVLWARQHGRGLAVFHTGSFAPAGSDWMAVQGASEALIRDILTSLPALGGLAPIPIASMPGVFETMTSAGTVAFNAGPATLWHGAELPAAGIAVRP